MREECSLGLQMRYKRYSIFLLAKPRGKLLTAEVAALLLKTLREKSNPKNMLETNNVFCRLALRMLFLMFFATASPCGAPTWSGAFRRCKAEGGGAGSSRRAQGWLQVGKAGLRGQGPGER